MKSHSNLTRAMSPASLVIAVLALVLTAAGAGFAAGKIGTSDIRNGAVTTAKLHSHAVTGAKVKAGSLPASVLTKEQRYIYVGDAGAPPFYNGTGECVWLPASTEVPGLGDVAFRKDRFGTVHLTGLAIAQNAPSKTCDSSTTYQDGIAFILPSAYRPAVTQLIPLNLGGSGTGVIIVGPHGLTEGSTTLPAGAVYVGSTGTPVAALDDISFEAVGSPLVSGRVAAGHLTPAGKVLLNRILH